MLALVLWVLLFSETADGRKQVPSQTSSEHAFEAPLAATPNPTRTTTPTLPATKPQTTISATNLSTSTISTAPPLSVTAAITSMLALTVPDVISSTGVVSTSSLVTASAPISKTTVQVENPDAAYAGVISGTIIANRTEMQILFFVEGATYLLDPLRSIGLQLPRDTAALNLFNCDAKTPETQAGCFWDPYLLTKEGFYELVTGKEAAQTINVVLREAGEPPTDQVWVQNRTGKSEKIFFNGREVELSPAIVQEFAVPADTPALLYMQNCVSVRPETGDVQTVCEWAPRTAKPGLYYALVEKKTIGALPNSQLSALELEPLLTKTGETIVETPPQVTCRTLVPTLNVRSGPGLQYTIVQKVRVTGSDAATILVVGKDETGQWLAVDERIAPGGWVIAGGGFIECDGDTAGLPVTQPAVGELLPTPAAAQQLQAIAPAPSLPAAAPEQSAGEAPPVDAAAPTTPTVPGGIPVGYAVLIVNNGFDKDIRFTIDQIYRVELGPSEFDLLPGGSVRIVIKPGPIAFSVSTPWSGLSGNANLFVDVDQSRTLWVTFVPDPGSPGAWVLQY